MSKPRLSLSAILLVVTASFAACSTPPEGPAGAAGGGGRTQVDAGDVAGATGAAGTGAAPMLGVDAAVPSAAPGVADASGPVVDGASTSGADATGGGAPGVADGAVSASDAAGAGGAGGAPVTGAGGATGGLAGAGGGSVAGRYVVDTTTDLVDADVTDGRCLTTERTCSLRAAIMQTNHPSVGVAATIVLPAGTYLLTRPPGAGDDEASGDLDVALPLLQGQTLTIEGAGASRTIIDGNLLDRVLAVGAKAVVTARDLTIRNGRTAGNGGGVLNAGTLTLESCLVVGNGAAMGGGIMNLSAPSTAKVTLHGCTVSSNRAEYGGGVYADGTMLVVNSTFSGNVATWSGGGLASGGVVGQVLALYNTTVVDNRASTGGVDMSVSWGGGVFASTRARFLIANTLIARNTRTAMATPDDCAGPMESYGINLVAASAGCVFSDASTWKRVTPTTFGPLQDNGGPTATHLLLATSEAVDSTNDVLGCVDETGAPLKVDQRGAARPAGLRCDVGAVEFGVLAPGMTRP